MSNRRAPSEPEADTGHEIDHISVLTRGAGEQCGVPDPPRPFDADIGRELLTNLLAYSEAQFDIGKPRTDSKARHALRGEIDFHARREDKPLRQP